MPRPFCHEEAKLGDTLCPMAFALANNGGSISCVGRRCMAWRFVDTHVADASGELVPSGDTHGFCGLAGDPRHSRSDHLPY